MSTSAANDRFVWRDPSSGATHTFSPDDTPCWIEGEAVRAVFAVTTDSPAITPQAGMRYSGLDVYGQIVDWMKACGDTYALANEVRYSTPEMTLQTSHGQQTARPGDWIIRDTAGCFGVARRVDHIPAYDSTADTLKHSLRVGALMGPIISELVDRSVRHDLSKTEPPELATFNEYTPKLAGSTYGSDENKAHLAAMAPALEHHYANNRHHPQHFPDGVDGMTLADLLEMLADWKASTERHADGDLAKSLEINHERFLMSDQLTRILRNTAERYGWLPVDSHGQHEGSHEDGPHAISPDCEACCDMTAKFADAIKADTTPEVAKRLESIE